MYVSASSSDMNNVGMNVNYPVIPKATPPCVCVYVRSFVRRRRRKKMSFITYMHACIGRRDGSKLPYGGVLTTNRFEFETEKVL